MSETIKERIPMYTMKMQLYPTPKQAEMIDECLKALHLAYNITFHNVFLMNPDVCTEPNEDGLVWPDFGKMVSQENSSKKTNNQSKSWKEKLIEQNPIIGKVPAASITTKNGLFKKDAASAWKAGMHNRPINRTNRKNFHFYNSAHPRRSFTVQIAPSKISPSPSNQKVAHIALPKIDEIAGKIKARGFNRKIYFGKNGEHTFEEALAAKELTSKLTVCVSKDTCGDYFLSVRFLENPSHNCYVYREVPPRKDPHPIGLDAGVTDIAILSDGIKYENRRFKKQKEKSLRKMNRQLSRRWGYANQAFRDYNKAIRTENRTQPDNAQPLAQPSQRYLKIQRNHAKLERKIARRRETYYHQVTAEIIKNASFIGIETLKVKNMMKNRKRAYALQDAAMSDFLQKLKYKAERGNIPIVQIGMFQASSQTCFFCGERNSKVKNTNIREWTCPHCGIKHDRDINAAKNILCFAQTDEPDKDSSKEQLSKSRRSRKKASKKLRESSISDDYPELVVQFSKELTSFNNPRYIIINQKTKTIVDDAQGAGYRSIKNAKNCYLAKIKYAQKNH